MNKALQVSMSALTVGLLAMALHGAAHAAGKLEVGMIGPLHGVSPSIARAIDDDSSAQPGARGRLQERAPDRRER